ncbi:MAG: hypothetical protein N3G80_00965 [Candidatus Micrarchaeota archaeon]|nr:hypothetical protein [Candidatus Micrarchaeota archaeon]
MRILVFGNPLSSKDSSALKISNMLEGKIKGVEFVHFDTAEDLEKQGQEITILDTVVGIKKPRLISLSELELPQKPLSLHGFDLAWSLMLLKKLGKLKKATIIGVPPRYLRAHIKSVERLIRMLSAAER